MELFCTILQTQKIIYHHYSPEPTMVGSDDTATFYKKIIKKYLPSQEGYVLTFEVVDVHCLMVYIIKKGSIKRSMTIPLNNETKWKIVKRRLDSMFDSNRVVECTICEDFEGRGGGGSSNKLVSCNKCGNHYCLYCYTDIMKVNQGVIICPFCRYEFGKKYSPEKVDEMIQMTFKKAKCLGKMK